jgi:hypothetical protein
MKVSTATGASNDASSMLVTLPSVDRSIRSGRDGEGIKKRGRAAPAFIPTQA